MTLAYLVVVALFNSFLWVAVWWKVDQLQPSDDKQEN